LSLFEGHVFRFTPQRHTSCRRSCERELLSCTTCCGWRAAANRIQRFGKRLIKGVHLACACGCERASELSPSPLPLSRPPRPECPKVIRTRLPDSAFGVLEIRGFPHIKFAENRGACWTSPCGPGAKGGPYRRILWTISRQLVASFRMFWAEMDWVERTKEAPP
jgi:hypothetical protein